MGPREGSQYVCLLWDRKLVSYCYSVQSSIIDTKTRFTISVSDHHQGIPGTLQGFNNFLFILETFMSTYSSAPTLVIASTHLNKDLLIILRGTGRMSDSSHETSTCHDHEYLPYSDDNKYLQVPMQVLVKYSSNEMRLL